MSSLNLTGQGRGVCVWGGGGGGPERVLVGQSPSKHGFQLHNNIYDFFFSILRNENFSPQIRGGGGALMITPMSPAHTVHAIVRQFCQPPTQHSEALKGGGGCRLPNLRNHQYYMRLFLRKASLKVLRNASSL